MNDSIIEYHSSKQSDISTIYKDIGNCITLKLSKVGFDNTVNKLNFLVKESYNVFKDDSGNLYKGVFRIHL